MCVEIGPADYEASLGVHFTHADTTVYASSSEDNMPAFTQMNYSICKREGCRGGRGRRIGSELGNGNGDAWKREGVEMG